MNRFKLPPRRSGKTAVMRDYVAAALARGERVINAATGNEIVDANNLEGVAKPPRRLSNDVNSPDYHPAYVRVGVRIDGEERTDICWYDVDRHEYMTTAKTSHLATTIEPYWRYQPSRQQRRAEERWEAKRK